MQGLGRFGFAVILGLAVVPTSWGEGLVPVRRPVALAVVDGGASLLVANRRSGSISAVDTRAGRVAAEWEVGRGLADLAVTDEGRRVLAVDQDGDTLAVLVREGNKAKVVGRVEVARDPVAVLVAKDGATAVVASRWSRSLTIIGLTDLKVVKTIGLPFSPGRMAWVRSGARLVVADAFGGKLAVVDVGRGVLESVRTLPAHNIGGLAESPDGQSLVISHQTLSRLATTSFDDVHWGSVVGNHLRVLRIDTLLTPGTDADLLRGGRLIDLGETGDAAGDPAGIGFGSKNEVIVALSGVNQVGIGTGLGPAPRFLAQRIGVGRRPTSVAIAPDGATAYAVESLDDSVAVIELSAGRKRGSIALGPRPEPDAIERGERLFFDAKLSHDGWMSCQSCHVDGHTNGLVADTLGDGTYGAPKLTPTLLGVAETGPWTWTGGINRLEDQVRKSVETSMQGKPPTPAQVADLTAYLRSLVPPSPDRGDPALIERGSAVFRARGCADCHKGPAFTSPTTFDVGLVDEQDRRKFNPPSLRGVGRRDAFLHDGRARSLEDVFRTYKHPRGQASTDEDLASLIVYLKSL